MPPTVPPPPAPSTTRSPSSRNTGPRRAEAGPGAASADARAASPRAERTRAAILAAAERQFAQHGYSATRLEDVAAEVGIRRASIVYYFKDKRELYDATLAELVRELFERTIRPLSTEGPLATRIERAVAAWVDFVGERPTFARILLREAADATPERRPALLQHIEPFFETVEKVDAETKDDPASDFPVDPLHIASTIAGATVFFVAAMPSFVPQLGFDPLSPEHLETHKSEVLRITRRLLGTYSDGDDEGGNGA